MNNQRENDMVTGTTPRILVIDDEPGMRDMLAYELSHEGFDVETAENGMRALEVLEDHKFDLAITDLKMPGMSGVETLEAMRAIDPEIEVIVATGYATVETAVACMKLGAYDYIQKPYDLDHLRLVLDRAMQRSRLRGVVALYEASRALLETLNHDELTKLVVQMTADVLGAGAVALVLDEGIEIHERTDDPDLLSSQFVRSLVDRCRTASSPIRVTTDERSDANVVGSAAVYPLRIRDRTLGSIVVVRSAGSRQFSESEFRRGSVLASQVALSLDNARLYEDLERKVRELAETQEELVHAEKVRVAAELASGVAHEINNPLSIIKANLHALRDYSTTVGGLWLAAKEAAAYLRQTGHAPADDMARNLVSANGNEESPEQMDETVSEVASIVDDLLGGVQRIADLVTGFTRLAEPLSGGATRFDLIDLVAHCMDERRATAQGARTLDADLSEPDISVIAAREDVRASLMNLLAYCDVAEGMGEAALDLRCSTDADEAVVTVVDPSLRLTEEERMRVLEPRISVDQEHGRTMRLDMGMCLAYQLIRRNEGSFEIAEHSSGGTCFRIGLPAATSEPRRGAGIRECD